MKKYILIGLVCLFSIPAFASPQKNFQAGTLLDITENGHSWLESGKDSGRCHYRSSSQGKRVFDYTIQVGNTAYDSKYVQYNELQYAPTSGYQMGQSMQVRFVGKKKMLIQKPDGKKLVTTKIAKKWEVAVEKKVEKKVGKKKK